MAVVRDQGVAIHGLKELQQALERVGGGRGNFGIEYELQHRLRNVGEHVAAKAPEFIPHRTGRHGDPSLPRLEETLRVSVTQKYASVYTNSPYAAVQEFGGGPKTGWANRGPHIQRGKASRFLSTTVAAEREYVNTEMDSLLDWVADEWNRP